MHKDDLLTAFRGVSDSVQHVSFAYVSQSKSLIYFILGVKRKFPQRKFWVNTFPAHSLGVCLKALAYHPKKIPG